MAALAPAASTALAASALAQQPDLVVTATRTPEPVDQVPADLSVVTGEEMRRRGATDMATVLSLVPGVEAPAGGDAGPSSAVPSFWGLHEFDAFLLVVDGVPWGGAFNPSIATLDFTDVERVEVLKGAAPVMFGATAFVGVVQAIHYPAGEAAEQADIAYGAYGSVRGSASVVLPKLADYRQSLVVDGQNEGFADSREGVSNQRVLYRGALDLNPGQLTIDADITRVRDVPPSPVLRAGTALSALTPTDANFNPADARIDQDQYHLRLGYTRPTPLGEWDTTASYAYTTVTDVRAFLHPDASGTADTQNQRRFIDDGYVDSHLTHRWSAETTLILGADLLYGLGGQTTQNGNSGYTVPLDGSQLPPPAATIPVDEIGTLHDRRLFAGQYAQLDWKPDDRWDLVAGVRLNEAREEKSSSDLVTDPASFDAQQVAKTMVRPTETLGLSYRAWHDGSDEAVVYADVREAFKPAALDFGPDYTPTLLSPETAFSVEAGVKGSLGSGALTFQAEVFHLDFHNLVVATSSGALANAAGQRLQGLEAELAYRLLPSLQLKLAGSYHDSTFTNYLFFDGTNDVNVAGRQLPLSPHVLASAGLLYESKRGVAADLVARYIGKRYLDEENTAPVGGYTTLDASLGYGRGRYRVTVEGTNLSNLRPPVTSSEFGSQSFYLLPNRMLWLRLTYTWR